MSILYHYTNIERFMGIMAPEGIPSKTMRFRMSSSDYLNDEGERVHCAKILETLLLKLKGEKDLLVNDMKTLSQNEPWRLR